MKVVIAPQYQSLKDFIYGIPQGKYSCEKVFCNHRNLVELVRVGEQHFVVKKFKRPTLANCVIYTWFRKNKAQKAWENACLFEQYGLETAAPVAYIVQKKWGFFHTAWFISEYLRYPTIHEVYEACQTEEEKNRLATDLINYTLHLHSLKIVHRDYNRGNILVHKEDDGYHFALIDINRLSLKHRPGLKKSMNSLLSLSTDWGQLHELVPIYADARGFKLDDCVFYISFYKFYRDFRSRIKHGLKRLIGLEQSPEFA